MVSSIPIAIWGDPATHMLSECLSDAQSSYPFSTVVTDSDDVLNRLMAKEVDVAVLPTSLVLATLDLLDVLPSAAISVVSYPFTVLPVRDLGSRDSAQLSVEPGQELLGLISEIILKEQYGCLATRMAPDKVTPENSISLVPHDRVAEAEFALDLGREWFELVNYPLVWTLFVMRKGEADADVIQHVRDAVWRIDSERASWKTGSRIPEMERTFYASSLTYRLDDLAIASMTELCEYLFYYGEVGEIPQLVFAGGENLSDSEDD